MQCPKIPSQEEGDCRIKVERKSFLEVVRGNGNGEERVLGEVKLFRKGRVRNRKKTTIRTSKNSLQGTGENSLRMRLQKGLPGRNHV